MKKSTSGDIETRLARFLFQYRITPHTTTGTSPSELLFGRRLRSHLDLLRPQLRSRVQRNQERQKDTHDRGTRFRTFQPDDMVYIRNFGQGEKWLPATVVNIQGPLSYVVKLADGREVRRHVDHVRTRRTPSSSSSQIDDDCLPTPSTVTEATVDPTPPLVLRRSSRVVQPPERLMNVDV